MRLYVCAYITSVVFELACLPSYSLASRRFRFSSYEERNMYVRVYEVTYITVCACTPFGRRQSTL